MRRELVEIVWQVPLAELEPPLVRRVPMQLVLAVALLMVGRVVVRTRFPYRGVCQTLHVL